MSPRVNILGAGISAVSLGQAVKNISRWIDGGAHQYVNVCTVHTVMEARRRPQLLEIINRSGMTTPDGMPLVWLCHVHGLNHVTRVYGPDLLLAMCKHSMKRRYRHYFYGGAKGVAEQLSQILNQRFPGLQVAGVYSPPYRPIGALEESTVIEKINDSAPDIIWVGLGTPKQDYWVAQHRKLLNAPVIVAVGAAFDFHTGRVPQAPLWMQRSGLEWMFRFKQEPARLAYRYLVFNPLFIMHVIFQLSRLRHYPLSS
jgi:N-acetylglucosaminyldiphosphoundecaprenol N-acetyl-beta-D-mannosaminyltransferase